MEKYRGLVLKKAKISEAELELVLDKLFAKMIVLDDNVVKTRMEEAEKIMENIDANDSPFLAAALATDSCIWSDDKHFEKQKRIKVWKTFALAKELGLL